ncbi:MAG: hypothetical protein B6240_12955 [Desulfobacteraceae bacterium 4572_87]|nr:MAG: hypothetical protein B6240_12955 [Desulfobacteraceae bacterium 4572_87]
MNPVQNELLNWYEKYHRSLPWRKTSDPYRIWVSEVMLQQTRVQTVIPYYEKFLSVFPSLQMLAEADLQKVLKCWEGLGYYARARNLHRGAQAVMTHHGGVVPRDLEESNPGEFNQAMMELGALVCTPQNPRCNDCPLARKCVVFKDKVVEEYPRRIRKAPIPEYRIAVGVIWKDSRVLITQRKPEGLLGGLWEFPGGKIQNGETPSNACIREIKEEVNLVVETEKRVARIRHAYTHFKIVMDVFPCIYRNGKIKLRGPVDYRWIRLSEIDRFPFPGANRKFIPLLEPR